MIKRFKKRHLGLPPPPPKSNYEMSESIRDLINSLCPPSALHALYPSINDLPNVYSCPIFDEPFTSSEFATVISSLKVRSSPGLDRLGYDHISLLPDFYFPFLLDIFNELFTEGTFPNAWHHSLVFLIPKNSPNKYRPISLTSCCLKLMEKLILSRLDWWVEKNHILPNNQYGFRKAKSCQDNIGILTTEIYNGFISRHATACVFLDIAGAFDNVIPSILIGDLVELNLPPKLCLFIYNLIHYRELQFVINGEITESYLSYKGVPQGSILSPLLFNIYVAKCKNYVSKECNIIQFADDTAVFIGSSNLPRSLQLLESSVNRLASFLNSRGLDISSTKSALVVFARNRKSSLSYSINLCGSTIKSSSSYKFLGITLDSKLNGRIHTEALVTKCSKLTNVIRSLRGIWWGASPSLLLNIYKSLVRGSMEYGCFALPINNKGLMEKLEKVQRRALKFCIGLRQSTPCNVVLSETCISPLKTRFTFLTSKYILKALADTSHIVIDKLYELQTSLIRNDRYNVPNCFLLYKVFLLYKKFRSKIACFEGPPIYHFAHDSVHLLPNVEFTSASFVDELR